ncbi:hypothetical protein evm_007831 [Chilo suppressalis]|nr:hypothetical protein evm_007831 [Chilo suppressalis]
MRIISIITLLVAMSTKRNCGAIAYTIKKPLSDFVSSSFKKRTHESFVKRKNEDIANFRTAKKNKDFVELLKNIMMSSKFLDELVDTITDKVVHKLVKQRSKTLYEDNSGASSESVETIDIYI